MTHTVLHMNVYDNYCRYNTSMPDLAIPPVKCLRSVLQRWKEESMVSELPFSLCPVCVSLPLSFSLLISHPMYTCIRDGILIK